MSDAAAAEEEAQDQGLEIQAGRRSATIGAEAAADDQERIAVEEDNAGGLHGAEQAEAASWAYDDPASGYGPRR
ncbi:hypothetical protein [Luteipulveratus halotolerans]|uniref:Uncharacterized protein n=1 Tax=Luteipulveratus halotolerans TaxID=1631356 RepID=A0A0L6CEM9_9MICO|nr:hypothetical protein [Luteipulveratus halotolerans]KNX35843.1 hypothetical protein VV01_21370 [Luteipulveratus halotolerans]KNX35938.1 hypothetical protein VV01_22045 [Luteipulveratus halotolerans]